MKDQGILLPRVSCQTPQYLLAFIAS
jgi:hypothetical protein